MKKYLILTLASAIVTVYACGPSAEEKAATEKATQDSIATVAADSMRKAMEDSMMMAQQAMADSMRMQAMQDSLDMMKQSMNKPKPKVKTNEQKQEEEKKKQAKEKG